MTDKLQKDANGLFPGEAETGLPNFLRRCVTEPNTVDFFGKTPRVIIGYARTAPISPEASPQETPQNWVPPWSSTSPLPDA
jgi:hypothetical protein